MCVLHKTSRLFIQKSTLFSSKVNKLYFSSLPGGVENAATNKGPLHGIRVLDFSRLIAGPFCTMLLGDLGAEVIKVEKPGTGDDMRTFAPPNVENEDKELTFYFSVNRNKKSIILDLTKPTARDVAKELAMKSDIIVENFLPSRMSVWGLGYEEFKFIAPRLIYCSILGFGSNGPYGNRPGIDLFASSLGGLLHLTKSKAGDPVISGIPMIDMVTAVYAQGALMAALLERNRTGRGQKIECDLLSTQVSLLTYAATTYLNTAVHDMTLTDGGPFIPYDAYKTKDGYFSVACANDGQLQNLFRILNLHDALESPKFFPKSNALKNRKDLMDLLGNVFAQNTTDYWVKKFENTSLLHGPVNNMEQVFKDPQVVYRKMVQDVYHPIYGQRKLVGPAVTFSVSGNRIRSAAPALGEHTDSVLANVLSYSPEKIQKLRDAKIIG